MLLCVCLTDYTKRYRRWQKKKNWRSDPWRRECASGNRRAVKLNDRTSKFDRNICCPNPYIPPEVRAVRNGINWRVRQIQADTDAKTVDPVHLKFCVDIDFLEPSFNFGFNANAESSYSITNDQVREFLKSPAKEWKEVVTHSKLYKTVAGELWTNMRYKTSSLSTTLFYVGTGWSGF